MASTKRHMEAIFDLKLLYTLHGMEELVLDIGLLKIVEGLHKEIMEYLKSEGGCTVDMKPAWSGVKDGLTFTCSGANVLGLKMAQFYLNSIAKRLREEFETFLLELNISINAICIELNLTSAKCGLCSKQYSTSLEELERHVASHDDKTSEETSQNTEDPYFRNITDEMVEKPYAFEPCYVAQGRKYILMEDRDRGRISNSMCETILDHLEQFLDHVDKAELQRKMESATPSDTKSEKLTAKLMVLCDFFVQRNKKVSSTDSDESYPFAAELKREISAGRTSYGKIFTEAVLRDESKLYRQSQDRWIRFPKKSESVREAKERLDQIVKDRRARRIPNSAIPSLVEDLKYSLARRPDPKDLQNYFLRRLQKYGKRLSNTSRNDMCEAYLMGVCDYIIADREGRWSCDSRSMESNETRLVEYSEAFTFPRPSETVFTARERWVCVWMDHELGDLEESGIIALNSTMHRNLNEDDMMCIDRMVEEEYFTRSIDENSISEKSKMWLKLKKTCQYLVLKSQNKVPGSPQQKEKVASHTNDADNVIKSKTYKVENDGQIGRRTSTPEFRKVTDPSQVNNNNTNKDNTTPEKAKGQEQNKQTINDGYTTINDQSPEQIETDIVFTTTDKSFKMENSNVQTSTTSNGPSSAPDPFAMLSVEFKPIVPAQLAESRTNSPAPEADIPTSTSPVHDKYMTPIDVIKRFMELDDPESAETRTKFAINLNKGLDPPPVIEEDIIDWGKGVYEDESSLALPLQVVLNPHIDETEAIAKGRYKILMAKRIDGSIRDKEAEIILDGLKESLTQGDRRSLNQIFQQGLQQQRTTNERYIDVSTILTAGLKLTCFYLMKRAERQASERGDAYPYWYMFSKGENDTGLTGLSKNGQYKEFSTDFPGAEHLLNKCITILAKQNKVTTNRKIDKDLLRGGIPRVSLTLGNSVYVSSSREGISKAKCNAAYEALMKTEYGFLELPGVLVQHALTDKDTDEVGQRWACINTTVANRHGPKDWQCRRCGNVNWYHRTKCGKCQVIRTIMQQPVKHVIIRSTDPLKSANVLLQVLADQNKMQKRYKVEAGEYTHTAIMLLGKQKYQGTGYSPEMARRQVDYYALQQTSYTFISVPPGVLDRNAPVIPGDSVPSQPSEKESDQIIFQTLPNLILTHPHPKETSRIARGRYQVLTAHRQMGKLSDRETIKVIENLKRHMTTSDKEQLNILIREGIKQAKENYGSQVTQSAEISMALKVTCDYFMKQAQGNETMETGYPYAHMFSSYKGDSQLPNVARNGQYCTLDEGFLNNEEKMKQLIIDLGIQNNVKTSFDVVEVQESVFIAYATVGQHTYMVESTLSKEDASSRVAMEVLMKTEYAFSDLTTELQQFFRPKKPVMSVIVRSANPLKSAKCITAIMARQNTLRKRYSMMDKGYTFRAKLTFGNETYRGYGCTPLLARCMADLYCVQRTCFDFTTRPPCCASDIAGTDHEVVKEDRETLIKKRLANREGEEIDMFNEMTELISEDLKQTAKLSSDDYTLIQEKLEKLGSLVPETEEWKKYWPWLKSTRHLEYTLDVIQKKTAEETIEKESWVQQTSEDLNVKKDPEALKGEYHDVIEDVTVEVGEDKEDDDSEVADIELDFEDPVILRLLREPHVHEPDYIAKGRYEKYMKDRKEGRLKDPQTNIMLIAFKKTVADFEKNDLEQAINDGLKDSSGTDDLTAKLEIICSFFVKRSAQHKYNPKLYPNAAILRAAIEKPPPGTNVIEALPPSAWRSRNEQYITFHVNDLEESELRGVLSVLSVQNKIGTRPPQKSESNEWKLQLGDEVHILPASGSNTKKTLLHKALINTNYAFTALPRQLKKFADAAAAAAAAKNSSSKGDADSDTESRVSTARSDPAGSDSEDEGRKDESGIPWIPELEDGDACNKSAARRYEGLKQKARKLIGYRESKTLGDTEVSDIVRSVKSKLKQEDLTRLNDMVERQIKKHMRLTGQSSTSLSWRLTQRLQTTLVFIVNKLKVAAGDSIVKKEKRDRHDRDHGRSSYGRSSRHYSRDTPFMRKAARLPKLRVMVKKLKLKPGRRYDATKYMKNLPSSKSHESRDREKERSPSEKDASEKKRKRVIDSPSSEYESDKIANGSATSIKTEKKMEVDSDAEDVPSKKQKVETEPKEEKPSSSSNTSSNLFDRMMKKEKDRPSSSAGDISSKRSSTDSREPSPKPKSEDVKPAKREREKSSTDSREPSPKRKADKDECKPAVKDLTKPEKEKQRSRDEKKSKSSREADEIIAAASSKGPRTKLSWIAWIEPIDLSKRSPVMRYRALKARVAQIMENRKLGKLENKDASNLIKEVRSAMSEEDMDVIIDLATKALEKVPSKLEGDKQAKKAWKITQQLMILCYYLVGRLERRLSEDERRKEKRRAEREDDYGRKEAFLDHLIFDDKNFKSSSKDKKDKKRDRSDSKSKSSSSSSSSSKHKDSSRDKERSSKDKGSSKSKDDSPKEKKAKVSDVEFPSELPDIPLPWIQALEPINLMGSPEERYDTVKQKIETLQTQRKERSLEDADVIQLIKGIKDTLDEDDIKLVNPVIVKAVNTEPTGPEAELGPVSWKLSAQLNVLGTYILKRLEQQRQKAEEKRKANAAATLTNASAEKMEEKQETPATSTDSGDKEAGVTVTADFSPPSSGSNSPEMNQMKENIVNIVMTVQSDDSSSESGSSIDSDSDLQSD